jgi:hypothetical protein
MLVAMISDVSIPVVPLGAGIISDGDHSVSLKISTVAHVVC